MQRRAFFRFGASLGMAAIALASSSCILGTEGTPPDPNQFYFPTGLAVSPGGTALYVANSDFDLRYAGGTLQLFDARALRAAVKPLAAALGAGSSAEAACATVDLPVNDDPYLNPGACEAFGIRPFLRKHAFIGAFASRLLLVHDSNGEGARLFSPVRGDPSLTYVDVEDDRIAPATPTFRLDCNVGGDGFCGDDHRIGRNADASLRGVQMPPDPLGTAATSDGRAIVSAHQTQAAASLVVNEWGEAPYLSYFASNLGAGPTDLGAIPRAAVVEAATAAAAQGGFVFNHRDAFVVTYRGASQLDLIEHVTDSGSVPPRPFLVLAQRFPLTVSASNIDSRGVAIVANERQACEASCDGGDGALACLAQCAEAVPLKLYVANRSPASLLIGRIHTTLVREATDNGDEERITALFHSVEMTGSLPLDYGASHVRVGRIVDENGGFATRVFALAFDSRSIFVVDPQTNLLETIIRSGRGPQEFAVDSGLEDGDAYALGYVAHFTDSYVGIVGLDLRQPETYGQVIASLGDPLPPVEAR